MILPGAHMLQNFVHLWYHSVLKTPFFLMCKSFYFIINKHFQWRLDSFYGSFFRVRLFPNSNSRTSHQWVEALEKWYKYPANSEKPVLLNTNISCSIKFDPMSEERRKYTPYLQLFQEFWIATHCIYQSYY